MASFSVRGKQVHGTIYELKSNDPNTIRQAAQDSTSDSLDQVFFKAGNKTYLLEGDGLNLSAFKNGIMPRGELKLGKQSLNAQMLYVDNELNSASEGIKSLGHFIGAALVGSTVAGSALLLKGTSEVSSKGLGLAAQTQTLTQAVGQMGHLKDLPVSITKGLVPGFGKNLVIGTKMKTSHSLIVDKGLKTVEEASKQATTLSKAIQGNTSQVSQLSTSKKVLAIGVGIAAAVTVGAAVYGAYKGSEMGQGEAALSLSDLKGKVINP